jgi:hypothetical protein
MPRDLDEKPYSEDEKRVAKFFFDKGVGGGDDPIGALMASHEMLVAQRNALAKRLGVDPGSAPADHVEATPGSGPR